MDPSGGPYLEAIQEIAPDYCMGPDTRGLERVTAEEALAQMREHEKRGLCHTVWTGVTPFIIGICNCNGRECLGMRLTIEKGVKALFRGEYVAECDLDRCTGCRKCVRVCPFDAVEIDGATRKAEVNVRACHG